MYNAISGKKPASAGAIERCSRHALCGYVKVFSFLFCEILSSKMKDAMNATNAETHVNVETHNRDKPYVFFYWLLHTTGGR